MSRDQDYIELSGGLVITHKVESDGSTSAKLDQTLNLLTQLIKDTKNIMPGITDIKAAQAAEKADLVTLSGLVTQLLTAFASGSMTPADAQAVLDEITAQDTTVKGNIATIQAALPPVTPPTPVA